MGALVRGVSPTIPARATAVNQCGTPATLGVMTPHGAAASAAGPAARLRVADGLELPLEAVTETFAILAKRRAGKSNAAVVLAEEMFDHGLPWVAVDPKGDWWGVRAAGAGSDVPGGLGVLVFGGDHGDVPLEPGSGALVAELVAQQRLTCVLDVSTMTKADQRRFLVDFATTLYRRNTQPLHVFCEEADEYIPQRVAGENAKLVGAFETLIKRGGFRGIGVTLISQRSASINKDALSQIETLIAMRTPSPQDRKAILGWVDQHAAGSEAVADLPGLDNGEAWVFSPQWLQTLVKVRFRRRRTFDSGATPKVGGQPTPPAALAEVDLEAIKGAMAETIERAAAADPEVLRRRVRELEQQLQARPAVPERAEPIEPVERIVRVEVPVLPPDTVQSLNAAAGQLLATLATQSEQLDQTLQAAAALLVPLRDVQAALAAHPPAPSAAGPAVVDLTEHDDPSPPRDSTRAPGEPTRGTSPSTADAETAAQTLPAEAKPGLRSGARRMVESLGRMAPLRLTRTQWGTVARLKTTGGTWSTYLADIRRAGLLDETSAGYTLSLAGFDYLGGHPAPLTAEELQQHYRQILRSGAVKMLDALIGAYPAGLTRAELGDAAALATTGGTFSTYLSDLVRNGLAERDGDRVTATSVLMRGSAA